MKIHFVDPRDFKIYPRGYNEIMSLEKLGYKVTVIALDWNKNYPEQEGIFSRSIIKRIHPSLWIKHDSKLAIFNVFFLVYYILIKITKEKPKILHCHGYFALMIGLFYKIFSGCKVIYDMKEDYQYIHRKQLKIRKIPSIIINISDIFTPLTENIMIRYADLVLLVPTVNNYLYKRTIKYNSKCYVIKNVPPKEIEFDYQLIKKLHFIIGKRIPLIYCGWISKRKGIYRLFSVVKKLKEKELNVVLILVGDIKNDNADEIKRDVLSKNIKDSVVFWGEVDYYKVPSFLSVSKIAFELYEPTFWHLRSKASSKLFLYMRAGVPVIVSNFPGIGGIVDKYKCGITVDPYNGDEICEKIYNLINNKKLYDTIVNNCSMIFNKIFNWDKEEKKLFEAYKRL